MHLFKKIINIYYLNNLPQIQAKINNIDYKKNYRIRVWLYIEILTTCITSIVILHNKQLYCPKTRNY